MATVAAMTEQERSRFAEYRDRKRGGPPREPEPHGTRGAVLRHQRAGEDLCAACAASEKERQAELYRKRKAKAAKKAAPKKGGR